MLKTERKSEFEMQKETESNTWRKEPARHLLRFYVSTLILLLQVNEWPFLQCASCRDTSMMLSLNTPFKSAPLFKRLLLWLSYLNFDPDRSPLLLFVPVLSRYNCFPFQTPFFFLNHFFFCWCSFQLFFRFSPLKLNWLRWSSLGPVPRLRLCPSWRVTSTGPAQAAPPNEFPWSVRPPWCSHCVAQTVRVKTSPGSCKSV